MMNIKKIFPGTIYFKFMPGEEDPILIRLFRIKNSDCFVVEKDGEKVKMNAKEFSTYTRLNPDGLICFSIVGLDDSHKDVMVTIHRKEDQEDNLPYCVSRLSLYDVFTNTISPRGDGKMYLGTSISKDTCPANLKYCDCLACNSLIDTCTVGAYYDDTLDDILRYINTVNYDSTLHELDASFNKDAFVSDCHSVRQLLEQSHFMEDFWRGFNIIKAPWVYNEELLDQQITWIEDEIKREILYPVIIKFSREIDLGAIHDDYLLILDSNNDLYVMSYKRGEYVNRPYKIQALGDMKEVEMLEKMSGKIFPEFH